MKTAIVVIVLIAIFGLIVNMSAYSAAKNVSATNSGSVSSSPSLGYWIPFYVLFMNQNAMNRSYTEPEETPVRYSAPIEEESHYTPPVEEETHYSAPIEEEHFTPVESFHE